MSDELNILLVHPASHFSVGDVARGYQRAFISAGHHVRDYHMGMRMAYHMRAMGSDYAGDLAAVSKQASENVLIEAIYHHADVVVLVSGLVFHPVGLHLLAKARFPVIILHTESPYEDAQQKEWSDTCPKAFVCTHEVGSAEHYKWHYLPHAYDVDVHTPYGPVQEPCDVLFIGTGWPERVAFLSEVDWTGIDFQLRGLFPIEEGTTLSPYYTNGNVDNFDAVKMYRGAKICLNFHKTAVECRAESLNPRAFELAACSAFTLTDHRAEGERIFGETQPVFRTPAELEHLIRHYLSDPEGRKRLAEQARQRVEEHTFDNRAAALLAAWREYYKREGS